MDRGMVPSAPTPLMSQPSSGSAGMSSRWYLSDFRSCHPFRLKSNGTVSSASRMRLDRRSISARSGPVLMESTRSYDLVGRSAITLTPGAYLRTNLKIDCKTELWRHVNRLPFRETWHPPRTCATVQNSDPVSSPVSPLSE